MKGDEKGREGEDAGLNDVRGEKGTRRWEERSEGKEMSRVLKGKRGEESKLMMDKVLLNRTGRGNVTGTKPS